MVEGPIVCCSICLVRNERAPAVEGWNGAPLCRKHLLECGGPEDLRAPAPRFAVIDGGKD